MPSTPGMRTSVTTHPSCTRSIWRRNASAESWTLTGKPSDANRKESDRRTASSSSTTCTTASFAMRELLFVDGAHPRRDL